MPKEDKKKNIVQDVIPKGRSIRNIELPSRSKRVTETIDSKKQTVPPPVFKTEEPIFNKYEYELPPKQSARKGLYIFSSLVVLAIVFGISTFFKSAEIKITPLSKSENITLSFTAKKDTNKGDLGFQFVTVSKDIEQTVETTAEEKVERKAKGTIVVYNNYSTQPQKLVINTRFATPEGLIFYSTSPVTIPGKTTKSGKTISGSAEVKVQAEKTGPKYNIALKDFSIVGFKGTPKYTTIYGRSKTNMTGGFSGMQKIIPKEVLDKVNTEMDGNLKELLVKDMQSGIPANFVIYQNSIIYNFEPAIQVDSSAGNALLRKKGTSSGIIFDKNSLSRSIFSKVSPELINDVAKITNIENLNFSYATSTPLTSSAQLISFRLEGVANFIWLFDENKLKAELLGLNKKTAKTLISKNKAIKEAWITTKPFWNQTIPKDSQKVTLINTITSGLTE